MDKNIRHSRDAEIQPKINQWLRECNEKEKKRGA